MARSHGFLDPIWIQSRLHRFAQPSEVTEPIELLRAGVLFHARGLINTRAIQHNLDWVWPFWVERQFNPKDHSFIPRAFSVTHVNLTHRNWTAVGFPGYSDFPIIDPRGLVTPFWDGWSLDGWVMAQDGRSLVPSRLSTVTQRLSFEKGLKVITESKEKGLFLFTEAEVFLEGDFLDCRVRYQVQADARSRLVISLRPYNPEGVSFIHEILLESDQQAWVIDGHQRVEFNLPPEGHQCSDYFTGDVFGELDSFPSKSRVRCDVGMATGAAIFNLEPHQTREITVRIPLGVYKSHPGRKNNSLYNVWEVALQGCCQMQVPDKKFQFLFEAALRTLILHSPGDVFPGPYTYKRFWYRDAAFILHAMLVVGLVDRAEGVLDRFPNRQTHAGYFLSQKGEWDSNGEALWIFHRFFKLTGGYLKDSWVQSMVRGAKWLIRKRTSDGLKDPHAGLLPAGFSAEHLGPNDYYYWDNFWASAGLNVAGEVMEWVGEKKEAHWFREEAKFYMDAIEKGLEKTRSRRKRKGIPASPYRRMDAGAIGSMVPSYPLQLWPGNDPRILETVEFLLEHCFVKGGFFQDMIHSGINPYLTLHVAQVLLRAGDLRFFNLVQSVADCASPTGQWPEAIHPWTGGGCMGDGQHVWASAEWVLMMRNCFVREEQERLILGAGIPRQWLDQRVPIYLRKTLTSFGPFSIQIHPMEDKIQIDWEGVWKKEEPSIEVHLPGFGPVQCSVGENHLEIKRERVL